MYPRRGVVRRMSEEEVKILPLRESVRVFSKLLPYIARNWKLLIVSIICIFISTQLRVLTPLVSRDIIDKAIIAGQYNLLLPLSMLLLGLSLASGLIRALGSYVNGYFSRKLIYQLQVDVFKSLQRQSFAFFDRTPSGQLISRVSNDTEVLGRFLIWPFTNIINSIMMIVLAYSTMLTMNIKLSLMAITLIPILTILYAKYGMIIRPLYLFRRHQVGALTSVVDQGVSGIKTIKALSIEDYIIGRFRDENRKLLDISLKIVKVRAYYRPLTTLIIGIGMTIIMYVGALEVIYGTFTIGGLSAFISYLGMLMWPARSIAMFITAFQRAMTSAQRVFDIMSATPDVKEKPDAIELPPIKGHIRFENVSFGYDKDHLILKDINLEIKPGERVAIVGLTGSGKSTLIRLIPRFYEVTKGRILIDGYDIRDVKIKSLRRQIAIVSQEPFIFAGTIKENIALARPNASMKEIIHAAKVARLHDFIVSLPKGYDTIVGERGITLSGGQRQRLDIARAVLANPRILILDDPTSNLDAETEEEIVRDLRKIMEGRTTIIVTQRLPLIKTADRIIVLHDGRVVEEGTHEELMAKKGLYYKLYKSLLGPQRVVLTTTEERGE